jgi:hypothetical protein
MLIKAFKSQALSLSAIGRKVNSQGFLISPQHVLQARTVSLLFALFRVIWKMEVLRANVFFLAIKLKQILQLTLWNASDLEPFLKDHLLFIGLLQGFTVLFSLDCLIPTGLLSQDASLMHLHMFLYANIGIIFHTCQAQAHWMGASNTLGVMHELLGVASLVILLR